MNLVRYNIAANPWLALADMDRLFSLAMGDALPVASGWVPSMDVYEEAKRYVVRAELAGVPKENVKVAIEEGVLHLSGERQCEVARDLPGGQHVERSVGRFERRIGLPDNIAPDQAKAEFKDGLLTVIVPKKEGAKPKRIDVGLN